MHRGSDQHGPRLDEELKHEQEAMLRGTGPSHAEEFRDSEFPTAEEEDERRENTENK